MVNSLIPLSDEENVKNTKSSIRECCVATRLTQEQKDLVRQRAEEKGLGESEYLRSLIIQDLYTPRELRVMVASHVRMEKLCLLLLANLANGEELTNEKLKKLASDVDKTKFQVADARIAEAINTPSGLKLAEAMEVDNG